MERLHSSEIVLARILVPFLKKFTERLSIPAALCISPYAGPQNFGFSAHFLGKRET